ncbi:MAG: sulfatase-like hydrolase/transferase [Burkholderiales bacterium]|nr:sulfatase-like hydrolase/transferase [Burkholderiales bacterium]
MWLLAVGLGLSIARIGLLETASRELLECRWCVAGGAVPHELQFNAMLAALYLFSTVPRWRVLRWAARGLVLGLLVIALVDLAVLHWFTMRLSFDLALKFGSQPAAIESFLRQGVPGVWQGAALALAALLALVAAAAFVRREPSMRYSAWAILCPASLAFAMAQSTPTEFHREYLKNAAEAFFSFGTRARAYSDEFVRRALDSRPPAPSACSAGLAQRPALILLVVESLSAYHSKLISGLNDWTPELDTLAAREGLRLPNFFANGIDTEAGLIALLTGEPPMARGDAADTVFESFGKPAQTIPSLLSRQGYHTAFLTTGDLGFLDKGRWLKRIGFELVEGHDAAFYNGMPRLHFKAAPDEALYDRALQYIGQRGGSPQPLFLMLETVSTHHRRQRPCPRALHRAGRRPGRARRAAGVLAERCAAVAAPLGGQWPALRRPQPGRVPADGGARRAMHLHPASLQPERCVPAM